MAAVAAALTLLTLLSGALAQAPTEAPVMTPLAPKRQMTPAPVAHETPAPELAPKRQMTPAPVAHAAPAPELAPKRQMTPAPVAHAAPTPATEFPAPGPGSDVGSPETGAAPPSSPCLDAVLNMSDCLTFVQKGSNLTSPEKACCPELAGLVDGNPVCLCQLLGNASSLGIEIDVKKALTLPAACAVQTPPVSSCALVGFPVGPSAAPMTSPSPAASKPGLPPFGSIASPPDAAAASSSFRTAAGYFSPIVLLGVASMAV